MRDDHVVDTPPINFSLETVTVWLRLALPWINTCTCMLWIRSLHAFCMCCVQLPLPSARCPLILFPYINSVHLSRFSLQYCSMENKNMLDACTSGQRWPAGNGMHDWNTGLGCMIGAADSHARSTWDTGVWDTYTLDVDQ
jgi:hypothetical protein